MASSPTEPTQQVHIVHSLFAQSYSYSYSSSSSSGEPTTAPVVDSICIGSGRFLRAVLVPALVAAGYHPAIISPRNSRSFLDSLLEQENDNENENDSGNENGSGAGAGAGVRPPCWTYEVDTVQFDGSVETTTVPCWGAGLLGSPEGKRDVLELCAKLPCDGTKPTIVGIGVTEAGLSSSSTTAMKDLYDVLVALSKRTSGETQQQQQRQQQPICVINTDNVSRNGDVLRGHMTEIAQMQTQAQAQTQTQTQRDAGMREFLAESVVFPNTMVDRITAQRPGSNGLVPRAEPTPPKALVLEDLDERLPAVVRTDPSLRTDHGVVIRTKAGQLDADIALKLRVANGTHTAIAHAMAVSGMTLTDVLSSSSDPGSELLMKYLDSFFENQIRRGVAVATEFSSSSTTSPGIAATEARHVYDDWRRRLTHAHFGLSTFFITQNGAAKGGIRIGPTVRDLVLHGGLPIACSTAFALAAILRFLTPAAAAAAAEEEESDPKTATNGIYRGWLDRSIDRNKDSSSSPSTAVAYADGLSYNLEEGWYEFRCDCNVAVANGTERPLPEALASIARNHGACQPVSCEEVVAAYLKQTSGGDLSVIAHTDSFASLTKAVATLYARMVAGDPAMEVLGSLDLEANCESLVDGTGSMLGDSVPLHYKKAAIPDDSRLMKLRIGRNGRDAVPSVVVSEVSAAMAIDLHTHLLPPTHGALCLWGIDELLTYHYLVAEYFVTAPPSVTPERFYALSKQKQADSIWKALFIDRSPVSEACRGVITTCVALGLQKEIEKRDLEAIREFYRRFRDNGTEGTEAFTELVFERAGVKHAVMTNIPFEPNEVSHWRPTPKQYSSHFRSACRVDPLLAGNRRAVEDALAASGYEATLEGARQFLHDWCETMKPEYVMASTPHDFVLPEDKGSSETIDPRLKTGVNEEAMKEPFAFASIAAVSNIDAECSEGGAIDELPSVIDEDSDFLGDVLMRVCEERDLPIALKIGAHREVNPSLRQAGDGVVAFADAGVLARLCTRFPKVRFLATFLSRTNQHEACVLATKFRNLHLYGCWWFCNNPSIIQEITQMRIEMLGTAFTAQHSDSRVLDQLLYKWPHSRAVIASVLVKEYTKLVDSGWSLTRAELRRDIRRLFGSSYEEFMSKSLV